MINQCIQDESSSYKILFHIYGNLVYKIVAYINYINLSLQPERRIKPESMFCKRCELFLRTTIPYFAQKYLGIDIKKTGSVISLAGYNNIEEYIESLIQVINSTIGEES